MPIMEKPVGKARSPMPEKTKNLYELVRKPKYEEKFVAFTDDKNPRIIAYDSNLSRLLNSVHEMGIDIVSTFFVPKQNVVYL